MARTKETEKKAAAKEKKKMNPKKQLTTKAARKSARIEGMTEAEIAESNLQTTNATTTHAIEGVLGVFHIGIAPADGYDHDRPVPSITCSDMLFMNDWSHHRKQTIDNEKLKNVIVVVVVDSLDEKKMNKLAKFKAKATKEKQWRKTCVKYCLNESVHGEIADLWIGLGWQAKRGALPKDVAFWRYYGLSFNHVEWLYQPQVFAYVSDYFERSKLPRPSFSCCYCPSATASMICSLPTCKRAICEWCYTKNLYPKARIPSPVALPLPIEEYQCEYHKDGKDCDVSMYKNVPEKATTTYMVSLFDENDTQFYESALKDRLNNWLFGMVPGYGHWLFHRTFDKKDTIDQLAAHFKNDMISNNFDNMGSIVLLIGVHSIDSTSRFLYGANNKGFTLNTMLNAISAFIDVARDTDLFHRGIDVDVTVVLLTCCMDREAIHSHFQRHINARILFFGVAISHDPVINLTIASIKQAMCSSSLSLSDAVSKVVSPQDMLRWQPNIVESGKLVTTGELLAMSAKFITNMIPSLSLSYACDVSSSPTLSRTETKELVPLTSVTKESTYVSQSVGIGESKAAMAINCNTSSMIAAGATSAKEVQILVSLPVSLLSISSSVIDTQPTAPPPIKNEKQLKSAQRKKLAKKRKRDGKSGPCISTT